ncbi:MAG: helix-turn-helix domain-containing protein [Bacilli bacterium]
MKPTKAQVKTLDRQLDLCRWVYNKTLALRKESWESQSRRDKLPKVSDERKKLSRRISRLYERVGNLRDDFAHQLSRKLVYEY